MHQAPGKRKTAQQQSAGAPAEGGGLAFAAIVVANVALAFGPVFVRAADTGPVASAFWRITLAAPLLAVLAFAGGARPQRLPGGLWWLLALAGIAFAGDLGTWHIGIIHTTLANATLFGNCATLIFPLYGFLVARAWPTRMQGFALLLAALGGGLLLGRSYQLDPRNLLGDMLSLLAGLLYTLYFVLMARVRASMAPLSALALSTLASILPLFLYAHLLGERLWPGDWTPLIGMALASQVLGQGCMIYALGRLSPLVVGIALLIQPMVAGAIGWVAYGERLAAPDLIGVAMVAAALVLVRREPKTEGVRREPKLALAPVDAHVEAEEPR
ncbi:membrane protein [Sphingomonas metalli]|uniref:Membrane protein n=1 Tax=Sphingomonas metalli TaxID=1779358 RepID=A0A916TCK5_9SPHN|nr:DMT family transporter [Sphingomonas metalli]GGB38475.1 membrane protein [Sphingomonas metalli]